MTGREVAHKGPEKFAVIYTLMRKWPPVNGNCKRMLAKISCE